MPSRHTGSNARNASTTPNMMTTSGNKGGTGYPGLVKEEPFEEPLWVLNAGSPNMLLDIVV